MSRPELDNLVRAGSLREEPPGREELAGLVESAERRLRDARNPDLSDDSRFTELALRDQPVDDFITQVFEVTLTRPPRPDELEYFSDVLSEGYADRRVPGQVSLVRTRTVTSLGVSWTNHLIPEANDRKISLKHELDKGDPPTQRLTPAWRETAEDLIWTLLNSPEFVFVP